MLPTDLPLRAAGLPPEFAAIALEAVGEAVIAAAGDGRVIFWNAAAEQLYGYPRSEALGCRLGELVVPPGGMPAAVEQYQRVLAGERLCTDSDVRDRDGRVFPVHVTTIAVRGDAGEIVFSLGVSYEVSEQRAAQARVHELAELLESSGDAVVGTDVDGVISMANLTSAEVLGRDRDSLLGTNALDLLPADRREAASSEVEALRASGTPRTMRTEIVRDDGTVMPASVRLSLVRQGDEVVAVSAVVRDVTAETRIEERLRTSEAAFRARFDQTPLPQAELAMDGRVARVNDALCRLTGRSREQLEGSTTPLLRHATSSWAVWELRTEVLAGRRESGSAEALLGTADGRAVPVVVHMALQRSADGERSGVAVFIQDLTELRAAQRALDRTEALFDALARQSEEWSMVIAPSGELRYASPGLDTFDGWRRRCVDVAGGWQHVHPADAPGVRELLARVAADPGNREVAQFRVSDRQGDWRWAEMSCVNHYDHPDIAGMVCQGRDVTERVEAERAVRRSEALHRAVAETAREGIWITDGTGATAYANQQLAAILGQPAEALLASAPADVLGAGADRPGGGAAGHRHDHDYRTPGGEQRVLQVTVTPLPEDAGCVTMVCDVTDERRAEDELRRRALLDGLTGLASRALLADRLEHAVRLRTRQDAAPVALLFADLDQFKLVNDSWGHAAGDHLLVQVAERLTETVRPQDTVARFGGDEFVVLCEGTGEPEARDIAQRLLAALGRPFEVEGRRTYVSASIGVAVSSSHGPQDLLRFADVAMYDAKARGRNQVRVYEARTGERASTPLQLTNDLREALARDGLSLAYQPVVELVTGRLLGVEALARWQHPVFGAVPPAEFVRVAEQGGFAPALDRWALRRAARDAAALRELTGEPLQIAVNVSARHLGDGRLEQTVTSTLPAHAAAGTDLRLELTESAIMDDPEHARALLGRLRDGGVETSVDDFGTGYSSLSYLRRLPVTALKIDRSFVQNLTDDDGDCLAIATAIVDLGRAMRLAVVAEGIETPGQLSELRRLGCTSGQGWLWSPALPLPELADLVAALPGGRFAVG